MTNEWQRCEQILILKNLYNSYDNVINTYTGGNLSNFFILKYSSNYSLLLHYCIRVTADTNYIFRCDASYDAASNKILFKSYKQWLFFNLLIKNGCYIGFFFKKKILIKKSQNPINELISNKILETYKNKHFNTSYGLIKLENTIWIISEYVHGDTLYHLIKNNKLSDNSLINIITCIDKILIDMQKKCWFAHNDLHPKNIIVTNNDPVIIDYELSTFDNKIYSGHDISCLVYHLYHISSSISIKMAIDQYCKSKNYLIKI